MQQKIEKLSKRIKEHENENRELQLKLETSSKTQDESFSKLSSQLKAYQIEGKSKDKQIYELKRLAD